MPRALGANLSHMLKDRGVEVIFGIPGVHNQELYRGIEEAGLTHVLARHEQGAGFMADGYARATGRPGVAYVITGPGLCNIMTPMGQAYSDSVSMLVISSCLDIADLGQGRGRLHEMKDQALAGATVCDWSQTAMDAASAYQLIDRALVEFSTRRKRPKHVQVPIEVLGAMSPEFAPKADVARLAPPAADAGDVAHMAQMIAAARRPLFVFGGGAVGAGRHAAQALVEAAGGAAFCTYAARGLMAGDHPAYFGSTLARASSAEVFAEADLVIAIGTAMAEVDLWRHDAGHRCPLIRVDIDPAMLTALPTALPVLGDAAGVIAGVTAALTPKAAGWSTAEVARRRKGWNAEIDAERPYVARLAAALQAALPADTMVFSDMTSFAYGAKEVWDMPATGLWHHPYGFGTLGYAMPAAIGGKIGRGAAPVIAIAGDYGFQYTLQELMVAVELRLSLPIILWDNGKLGEIEASMVQAQIAPNAVIQQNPDFLKLADAYGAASAEPQSLADIKPALDAALAHQGPTIIRITPKALGL